MRPRSENEKNIMAEAQRLFIEEVKQRLPDAQRALNILSLNGYNDQACNDLYRFGHTLKGSGQSVGIWDIADTAAEMVVAMLLVQKYGTELGEGILNFLKERMEEILEAVTDNQGEDQVSRSPAITSTVGKKILIVDDDIIITKVIKEGLEKQGFSVTVCHDIPAAESYLQVEQPALMVLDIVMPSGDGIDFCRKIRSNRRLQIVPIIFLTVKSKLQDKLAGFATGADDYLCKPFAVDELLARIRAVLDRINTYKDLVLKDELTRVYNRRYLDQRLEEEIARGHRANGQFSLAMIDLNLFKNVNDHYGHVVGDEVLQCLVDRLKENLRTSDVICRYGGDEFVVVFPDNLKVETHLTMQRIEQEVALTPLNLSKSQLRIPLTISSGIASFPEDGDTSLKLLTAADAAMYQRKIEGRTISTGAVEH